MYVIVESRVAIVREQEVREKIVREQGEGQKAGR